MVAEYRFGGGITLIAVAFANLPAAAAAPDDASAVIRRVAQPFG
jgi:hypothetical protein